MIFESAAGAAAAWAWDKYGKEFMDKMSTEAKIKWKRIKWESEAKKYCESIIDLYGTTWILGKHEPVPLSQIYTDLCMLDQPNATRRYSVEALLREHREGLGRSRSPRLAALRAIDRNDRLFILGRPGAGKTTFLRHVALKSAAGQVHGRHRVGAVAPMTPIFVTLRDWAEKKIDLMQYLERQFEICDFPEPRGFINYLLEMGLAIVLFDGLDEVGVADGDRQRVISAVKDVTSRFRGCKYVITCRVAASEHILDKFKYAEIADFTPEQIETYVGKWFSGAQQNKGRQFLVQLGYRQNTGISYLADNPLLLSLLCLAFEASESIPWRRVEVYEQALDALLRKWDASRGITRQGGEKRDEIYQQLTRNQKHEMLAEIAYPTFLGDELFFSKSTAATLVSRFLLRKDDRPTKNIPDGDDVLRAIEAQHGILVERAQEVYSFSHLTFHEYYAARYVAGCGDAELLQALVDNNLLVDYWREVFIITANLLEDSYPFFALLLSAAFAFIEGDKALEILVIWAGSRSDSKPPGYGFRGRMAALNLAILQAADHFDYRLYRQAWRNLDWLRDWHAFQGFMSDDFGYDLSTVITRNLVNRVDQMINLSRGAFPGKKALVIAIQRDTVGLCKALNLEVFEKDLRAIRVPDSTASEDEWESLSDSLIRLKVRQIRQPLPWAISTVQADQLLSYMKVCWLIYDCLEGTNLAKKDTSIVSSIMRVPGVPAARNAPRSSRGSIRRNRSRR